MKTKLLFFDMEFTSLSPDAQIISLGIVSDCGKSLYSEFSDFDINRCDDWVKENVVEKLLKKEFTSSNTPLVSGYNEEVYSTTGIIKHCLLLWLEQFSDYQIQFVADCGTYDWYWLVQLLAEWDALIDGVELVHNARQEKDALRLGQGSRYSYKIGLPKLPDNISPVPEDLNDLIALKKGISHKEAFDLDREEMAGQGVILIPEDIIPEGESSKEFVAKIVADPKAARLMYPEIKEITSKFHNKYKHSAIWDAKVIKEIYQKLK